MSTIKFTKFNGGQSFRKENRFIYEWTIHDFNSEDIDADVNLPSIKFEFELSHLRFNGELSLLGNKRTCRFNLRCTSHPIWKVTCFCSGDRSLFLDQDLTSTDFELTHLEGDGFNLRPADRFKASNKTIKIEVMHVEYVQQPVKALPTVNESKSEINRVLVELFKSNEFWDVTFEVGGLELRAYKGILASHSKVFAAMFQHGMREAQSNRVVIDDIEHEVFQEMLRYMYTGEVRHINKMALKLLSASDKYDLQNLKNICAHELASKISTDTAAEILILADLHKVNELKEHAMNFINNNSKAVANTEGWKIILENHCHLLAELYLKVNK